MIVILLFAGLSLPLSNADSPGQSTCPPRQLSKRSTYLPAETCSGEHIRAALQAPAGCTPREKVVKIPWPNNTDVHQLTPTHVTVARCGGGCAQNRQICVSTLSRVKTVPVLLGRCGITAGKCEKECASVQVEEDIECGCQCAVKKEDCNELQHYREDLCSCKCLDLSLARTCHESGHMWDPASCSCKCPIKLDCSSGLVFDDNATCSCIPFVSSSNTVTEIRSERSSINIIENNDFLIILILGGIIVLFILITTLLVYNNYCMKRKLRAALNPSTSNKNLYCSASMPVDPDNTMHLLDSETEFSSERPTDSSLCSDSDTRTNSPPTHRMSIAPSDHSSLSQFTPGSTHPNPGSNSSPPPSFAECISASRAQSPQSYVEGRPPIARKPVGYQMARSEDEMSVCSNSQMAMGQNCHMGQYSDMGQMDHMGQNYDMGHHCQHVPMNGSIGRMGHSPLYHSRQSQIVYPMVQNGSNPQMLQNGSVPQMGQIGSNPQIGHIASNPEMVQRGAMYPLNNGPSNHEMEQNGPILQLGRSGSLVRMGPKPSSSDCGPPLQINPNNCYVTY